VTFEERFHRLTERHEALTQSVELLLVSQREAAKQGDMLLAAQGETAKQMQETDRRLVLLLESVSGLATVAEAHEARLDDHEKILRSGGGSRG
jgi:nicotinate-nucleotide pyrophosphorylase